MNSNANQLQLEEGVILKKRYTYILLIILTLSIVGCKSQNIDDASKELKNKEDKITVAVSIVPQETFIKAVSGDLLDVITMIPPGNSPANYQPTPKEISKLSDSKIYFSIGVNAEKSNILNNMEDFNRDIKIVSLADEVSKVYPERNFLAEENHSHGEDKNQHLEEGRDPHIWLSPKRVKVIVETIKKELIEIDPNNRKTYERNAEDYSKELDKIDAEIKDKLINLEQKSFIMYHPAFGYFAEDYGLKMFSIEEDGKDTTVQNLQKIIELAEKENIKYIFYQEEFDDRQAEIVAKEINGKAVKVSPLSPDYIENLRSIVDKLQ